MSSKFKRNNEDSPFFMYVVAFVMFFLLTFTILSFMRTEDSPLYINLDKEVLSADIKQTSDIKKQFQEKDIIDKALDKIDDNTKYNNYQATYEKYREQQLKRRQQEFEQRQRLNERLRAQEKRERLKEHNKEKLARMQDVVKHPTPHVTVPKQEEKVNIPKETENTLAENVIIKQAMKKSPCSPETATAVAYFFHPNNSEPVELIFNNPGNNPGEVKLIFGDLPRAKEHILKKKMVNLNALLDKATFNSNYDDKMTRRTDIAYKVKSNGITTECSPYVYSSKDFYISTAPVALQSAQSRESYCKSKNARLPDPIELISVLLTGRYPAGLYWSSGRVFKLAPNKTVVTRSNMVMTQSYMLVDYENFSVGFVSQGDYGRDLKAYSLCVID
ncbi:hypothetical protein IKQ26_06640 [bacterium]|nr:hypothetical protein [bacterium]